MGKNTEWPNGFREGNSVVHLTVMREAHVIAAPEEVVPIGKVPIMYDDEGGCYVNVPPDELQRPF